MAGLQTMTEQAARTLAEEINASGLTFRAEPIPAKHGHWQVRLTYRPDSPSLARILTLPNERSWQDVKAMWDVA